MGKQQTLLAQKKRGPKPTGINLMVGVRMPPTELAALDAYIAKQKEPIGRPVAIRRLVEIGLKAKPRR